MDKLRKTASPFLARFRGWIQAGAALGSNIHLGNFFRGRIYTGAGKSVCVPGLNCYSCPAATGACPIGSLQAVMGSSRYRFSYYVVGLLILFGVLLGRFVCGFLCPFGWFQELLHKVPAPKLSTRRLKPLRYLKYGVLLATLLLPVLAADELGVGSPWFCKYLCPQGILEGALPLAAVNGSVRAVLGGLFHWKLAVLLGIVVLSVLFYRPFCKWLCPLGAFYALCNKLSLLQIRMREESCVSCGRCAEVCRMDVDVRAKTDHTECIRCGACLRACPTGALRYGFGLGDSARENGRKSPEINGGTKNET